MIWRWDQGRTIYFNFEAIENTAHVLLTYNGANMQTVDSAFRDDLVKSTNLPFAPQRYTIKRNYKRVFECSMLATYINNRLIISDLGRAIANGDSRVSSPDGYLFELERRFRYPFPAFNNYLEVKGVCFPFFAMLKLLLARAIRESNTQAKIDLDMIGSYLIANNVSGLEDLDFYCNISAKPFTFDSYSTSDQKRQVREMMSFIGQHSYLAYSNSELSLSGLSLDECKTMFEHLRPFETDVTSHNPVDDFLKLTAFSSKVEVLPQWEQEDAETLEKFSVQEGKKVFSSHFSRERNPALRRKYIKKHPDPICDICGRNMRIIYPWTENILEIHHLLPLSSFDGEDITNHGTSLNDVVGICPSCHRAVHLFYKKYLEVNKLSDFTSDTEAREAYFTAKSEVKK